MFEELTELIPFEWGRELWTSAVEIWQDGGWAMIAIAVIATVMFLMGFNVLIKLRGKGFLTVPERVWRRWIDHPLERRGKIGELLDGVGKAKSIEELEVYFDEIRSSETVPFERDLRVMKIFVSAAPLVGLLGTVTGMLSTFGALSSGSGGDKTMAMVASGISEALITTETGLVIALPGLFFQYQLSRHADRYKVFLAHLQSVCTQKLQRKFEAERLDGETVREQESLRDQLANRLRERLAAGAAPQTFTPTTPTTIQ